MFRIEQQTLLPQQQYHRYFRPEKNINPKCQHLIFSTKNQQLLNARSFDI